VNCEFMAVYRTEDGHTVEFQLAKDGAGSYRLHCENGLYPIRWFVGNLEFKEYRPADPSGSAGQFMNQILSTPARKTRPALQHGENAA
jgi:hypothetical protein